MSRAEDMLNLYHTDSTSSMDSDESSDEDESVLRAPRRYVRDGQNPFEYYNDIEFKRRFRFSKESTLHGLLPRIEGGLVNANNRGLSIPPVIQLLVCLRFYATASFQLVNGDLIRLSQSTISRIIFRVSTLIAAQMYEVIKMPVTEEAETNNRQLFRELGEGRNGIGFPNVDGAIDCTHIRLSPTRFQNLREDFRNRQGYYSLNVQAVVGPRMEFLDIVPEWPGIQLDSIIFQTSRLHKRYHERQLTGILVGDAAYPCLPFLLTPFANPITDAEKSYNIAHRRTRSIVERAIAVWKRRFPCLSRGLGTKLLSTATIIVACAVLHNLSLTLDNILPEEEPLEAEEEVSAQSPPHWQPEEGCVVRQALIETFFH